MYIYTFACVFMYVFCSEKCGLLVAIALTDMHECEIKKLSTKKLKSQFGIRNSNGLKIQYQPRSAFRLFM